MKRLNSIAVKVIIAILIGFLWASAFTDIAYTCPPETPNGGCFSLEKALMHPHDFLNNKQDSLIRFSEHFAQVSLTVFALLFIFGLVQKRKPKPASRLEV